MPGTKRLGAPLALLAAVAALSGCGSDEISGEIPANSAPALNEALNGVSTTIETDCAQAQEHAQDFIDAVNLLPQDSGELKSELQGAGDNLRTLVSNECPTTGEPATTSSTTEPTTTDTTTEPTTTDTTTTDTTTTETTTTDTTTTDQTRPPGDGDGGGPGDGGTGGTGGPGGGDE